MSHLKVEIEGGIARLIMNRPEARNALSLEMRAELDEQLHALELDDTVRCLILEGAGEHFMAGGDIKSMVAHLEGTSAEARNAFIHRVHNLHPSLFAMRRMPKPIVAKVKGAAAGAGVSFALACDLVVASKSAFFTLAYANIGTTPDGSSTFQLPRTVSIKHAMEMTLLGDRISAQRAYEMGLVNFVEEQDALDAKVDEIAHRLAAGPTFAYGRAKKLLYDSMQQQWETQLQAEAEAFAACASREDFREGVTAFIEKRKPRFTGR